jgi:hypothetical protein
MYVHYTSLPKPTAGGEVREVRPRQHQGGRQRSLPKAFQSVHSSTASITSTLAQARIPPIREDPGSMLLVTRPSPPRSPSPPGEQDPFDVFYVALQEMLSKLTHPLAFASVPLDGTPEADTGESFYLVPNAEKRPLDTKTLEEYSMENRQLKMTLDHLSKKLASYKEVTPARLG